MKLITNPVERVGAKHIKPNWRFELLQNPAKYKMQDFVSIPENNASCLKRFISAGLSYEVNYVLPEYLQQLTQDTTQEQKDMLFSLWDRAFKNEGRKKIEIDSNKPQFKHNPVWNLKYVPFIEDAFLRKLIYHHSNFTYDADIKHAIDYSRSEEHTVIFKFIGYGIYCKLSDAQLAKRWNMTRGQIAAIRNLFFDFSKFPKDRIANFTYLRQLANIGAISDVDFNFYKRAFELGDLGIRAMVDYHNLNDEERLKIEEFLGKSVVSNTLNLNFTVKTYKDAVTYGVMVSNLASYYIKQKESAYFDAKIRNLDVMTRRVEGEMLGEVEDMSDLDREMVALLREHSLEEAPQIEYKTLSDLKSN